MAKEERQEIAECCHRVMDILRKHPDSETEELAQAILDRMDALEAKERENEAWPDV